MNRSRSPQMLAKLLDYALGRRPDEFGLIPDADGFVKIKDLLKALHEEDGWGYVNESHLKEVLLTVPAPAFEIDGNRMRALRREPPAAEPAPGRPPKLLYVPIRPRAHPWVQANGIHPSSHPRVVLTARIDWAERLGRRIDPNPVILTVNVHAAEAQGVAFTPFGEGLFLADRIPVGCFNGPPLPSVPPASRKPKRPDDPAERPAAPGSFYMDMERAAGPRVPESLKRRTRDGRTLDPKRFKRGEWSREKPPWKKN